MDEEKRRTIWGNGRFPAILVSMSFTEEKKFLILINSKLSNFFMNLLLIRYLKSHHQIQIHLDFLLYDLSIGFHFTFEYDFILSAVLVVARVCYIHLQLI